MTKKRRGRPPKTKEKYILPELNVEDDGENIVTTNLVMTPELVAVAIYEARGMLSVAARKLNTTVRVINRFVKDSEMCRVAAAEADVLITDFVEAKLLQRIKAGDTQAIMFYLRHKGGDRGYSDRQIEVAAENKQLPEEAAQEVENRESSLLSRLSKLGERLDSISDIDLSPTDYHATQEEPDDAARTPAHSASAGD